MANNEDVLPMPGRITAYDAEPIEVPEGDYASAAFTHVLPEKLHEILSEMRVEVEAEFARKITDPSPEGLDAAGLAAWSQIKAQRRECMENHFALTSVLMHAHVLLNDLFERFGAGAFLKFKNQLEALAVKYNGHHPYYSVPLEVAGLGQARAAAGILDRAVTYLASEEFHAYQQREGTAMPSNAARVLAARVGLARGYSDRVRALTGSPQVPEKPGGAAGLAARTVFAVSAEEVDVDLSPGRDPRSVLLELRGLVDKYVRQGRGITDQIITDSIAVGFNVRTGQFAAGEYVEGQYEMMQQISKQYVDKFTPKLSASLRPMLFLTNHYRLYAWTGQTAEGKHVRTVNLFPAQAVAVRTKTVETTTEKREQTASALSHQTANTVAALEETVESEKENRKTDDVQYAQHLDTSRDSTLSTTTTGEEHAGYGGGGSFLGIGASANVGHATSTSDAISTSAGVEAGTSVESNLTREETAAIFMSAVQNHVDERSSTHETVMTEAVEQAIEAVREETQQTEYQNPNDWEALTAVFRQVVEEHTTFLVLEDVRLRFANGLTNKGVPAGNAHRLLDEVLRPDAVESRRYVLDKIRAACRVLDHKHRVIDLWDEETGVPRLRRHTYAGYLEQLGDVDEADGADMKYYRQMPGVVLTKKWFTEPSAGLIMKLKPSNVGLGALSLRKAEARVRGFEIENESREADVAQKRALVDNIHAVPDPSERAYYSLLGMASPRGMLDRVALENFLLNNRKMNGRKIPIRTHYGED